MENIFKVTLKAARINKGYTLKQVAAHTKKCADTIAKYEVDSSYVPHELLVSLLKLYDVPYVHIFFGKESEFHGLTKKIS